MLDDAERACVRPPRDHWRLVDIAHSHGYVEAAREAAVGGVDRDLVLRLLLVVRGVHEGQQAGVVEHEFARIGPGKIQPRDPLALGVARGVAADDPRPGAVLREVHDARRPQ